MGRNVKVGYKLSDVVDFAAAKTGTTKKVAGDIIDAVIALVIYAGSIKKSTSLGDIGNIEPTNRGGQIYRNPKTKELSVAPRYRTIKLNPSSNAKIIL
jgi:nucleoid DNA-binding protein